MPEMVKPGPVILGDWYVMYPLSVAELRTPRARASHAARISSPPPLWRRQRGGVPDGQGPSSTRLTWRPHIGPMSRLSRGSRRGGSCEVCVLRSRPPPSHAAMSCAPSCTWITRRV